MRPRSIIPCKMSHSVSTVVFPLFNYMGYINTIVSEVFARVILRLRRTFLLIVKLSDFQVVKRLHIVWLKYVLDLSVNHVAE